MVRRSLVSFALLLALAVAVSGCGQKTAQDTGSAASDSLLAASPVEQPEGQIQPESLMTQEQPAEQQPEAPAPAPKPAKKPASAPKPKPAPSAPTATVPAGTSLGITMGTALTSETATAGQAWSGTLNEALAVGSNTVFPAGSTVEGVVDGVAPAARGDRAFLVLRVTAITANGNRTEISASADSMVAGSTRKRNIGAIAGGAAAGALIGKAVGGTGKSAAIGGLIGGAAATGAVAASKGFQVEVPQGKSVVFHVNHDAKVKL